MPDVSATGGEATATYQPSPVMANNEPLKEPGEAAEQSGLNSKNSADGVASSPTQSPTGLAGQPRSTVDPVTARQVEDVLSSGIGIATLLNRLKQSIASAKEFAVFLKKRAVLEEDHAQSLKKLCRMSQESMRRPEHRQESLAYSYDEMMQLQERMAEKGVSFATSLIQMHDDLLELIHMVDRNRKIWKSSGLAAEQKVADLEQAMRKSKAKYDSLAEEYDRARTGDSRKGFGLKGPKSAAQHEEDLFKKTQTADATYHSNVQTLQSEKATLLNSTRPETISALKDLIKETDSGLLLQMQKYAAFNEKLLLDNGMIVSPMKIPGGNAAAMPRSFRQIIASVDNERDLNGFVSQHYSKVPPTTEVKYERNPILNPQPSSSGFAQAPPPGGHGSQPSMSQGPLQSQPSLPPVIPPGRSSMGDFGFMGSSPSSQGPLPPGDQNFPPPGSQDPTGYNQPHNRSFSQGNMMGRGGPPLAQQPQKQPPFSRNSIQPPGLRHGNGLSGDDQGAPQLGALPFQGAKPPPNQPGASFSSPQEARGPPGAAAYGPPPANASMGNRQGPPQPAAPARPVFGLSLNRLYERDGLAVPIVVYQCIQAVDLYGLAVEGIYRQSGSVNHVNKLKSMFDTDSQNPALDFRNPENFYHDVNSVSGLLKQFLRDLPDPLFTLEHHDSFINAAKQEDDIVRRDSLHAIINSLPDPNYATLRALILHLYRVMDNCHLNRMNSHNLAVIFGPTLMGTDPSTAIADAGWQIKVVDTVLQNTYQIFDED